MFVPDEFSINFNDHNVAAIEFGYRPRLPVAHELPKLLLQINYAMVTTQFAHEAVHIWEVIRGKDPDAVTRVLPIGYDESFQPVNPHDDRSSLSLVMPSNGNTLGTMKAISRLAVVFAACSTSALFAADAAANWKEHCAKCHGSDGRGDTKMGHKLLISDLTDAKFQAKFTDADAAGAIKNGLKDAKGKTIMKRVRALSNEEVTSLVSYVRGLKK